jgi:hypothetical protein
VSVVLNLSRKSQIKKQTLLSVISRSSLRALRSLAKQSALLIETIPQFKKADGFVPRHDGNCRIKLYIFKFCAFQVSKPAVE